MMKAQPVQVMRSVGGHQPLRRSLAMVFSWQKALPSALASMDLPTHVKIELPRSQAAGRARAFFLVTGSSTENSCVLCLQVDYLRSLVAEL